MENQINVVLEPLEKRERRLLVNWPDKKVFEEEKKKFISDHMGEMKKAVAESGLFSEDEEENINEMAMLGLCIKYVLEIMRKISPISLDNSIEIVDDFEYYQDNGSMSNVTIDNKEFFTIYFNKIYQMLDEGKTDLDAYLMSGAVHEFAHMIYDQEADIYKNPRKIEGENEYKTYHKYGKLASWESSIESYVSLDMETRARIWQLNFLKHYFPESDTVREIEEELHIGRQIREARRVKIKEIEERKRMSEGKE